MPDIHLERVEPVCVCPSRVSSAAVPSFQAGVSRYGSDTAVLAELNDIVRQVLEDPTIALDMQTRLEDVTGWDSMNHVAILVEVECRFGLLFAPEECEEVPAVADVVRLIRTKQSLRKRAVC